MIFTYKNIQQKHNELYNKLQSIINDFKDCGNSELNRKPTNIEEAKQCALIAVEFARQEFRDHCVAEYGTNGSPDDHFDAIKQEIQQLW